MNAGMQISYNSNNTCDDDDDGGDENITRCQSQVKNALLELRDRRRQLQDFLEISDFSHWNIYDETFFLHAVRDTSKSAMYPLHKALKLHERNDELEGTVRHLIELHQLADG